MCISGRPFLVCAVFSSLNLMWVTSYQIWPPTQVLYKQLAKDELLNLTPYAIAVPTIPEFDNFIKQTLLWVDKSLLIETLFEIRKGVNKDVIIVTSNPRWGKSMNLNMFAFYCELYTDKEGVPLDREQSPAFQYFVNGLITDNGKYIDKAHPQPPLISSYQGNDQHLANYPVIRLHGGRLTMQNSISSFRILIFETYRQHAPLQHRLFHLCKYGTPSSKHDAEMNLKLFNGYYDKDKIMNMESDELLTGIKFLCSILEFTYERKVVVVYDEHDHYLHEAYFGNTPFQSSDKTLQFQNHLNKFMLTTFKDNSHLKKALITGVLSVHEATYLSNLNHVDKLYVFDYNNIFPFYGIFDWELQKLMELRGLDSNNFDVLPSLGYDGFRTLANLTSPMFSTYSVANFISSTNPSVISYQQTGSIVSCMTKMLNQPTFEDEMLDFVKNLDDTFASIFYPTFKSLSLEDCELMNKLKHGIKIYDPVKHRNVVFSHLLNAGLVAVAKNQTSNPDSVDVKIPNEEVMYYIKSKIIAKHDLTPDVMNPAKSAFLEYMRGKDDSATFPKLINQLGSYLSKVTRGKSFGSTNLPNGNETQILSKPHYSNERSVHTLIFCFLLNTFSKIIPLQLLDQQVLGEVRFANELIVQRYGFNKRLDTYIEQDHTALIIEFKQGNTGDSIESALKQALAYGFMYQAYNISYPVLKFMALRVSASLHIESQCVTIPTAKFRQVFSDWNKIAFRTENYNFKNWETYAYTSLVHENTAVKYSIIVRTDSHNYVGNR